MKKWILCQFTLFVSLTNGIFAVQDQHFHLSQIRASFSPCFTHSNIETSQGNIVLWDSQTNSEKNIPAVLFIHGHGANKEFFEKQLKSSLFTNYRLIALDLPGYGESEPSKDPQKTYQWPGFANVVTEVIRTLDINNLVVVGWSLGGHIALELTSRLPQLKGLLITGTPPIELSQKGMSQGFKVINAEIFKCFGKGNLTYEEAQLFATVSGYDFTEEKEFIVEALLQTSEGAKTLYPPTIVQGIGENELKIVAEWPNPIAVIAGEQELVINNEYIIHKVKFKNLWEDKVHVISKGGHAVFMECPDEFNLIMERFFQEIFIGKNAESCH